MEQEEPSAREERWLSTALEEYRSIRTESMEAVQSHLATLRYGIAGIVVLIGLALRYTGHELGWLVALALTPVAVLFVTIIWMGEYERMARAGHYLAAFERRINATFTRRGEGAPLGWENWLRAKGPERSRQAGARHRYFFVYLIFLALQLMALVLGWHSLLVYRREVLVHTPPAVNHGHPGNYWLIPVLAALNIVAMVVVAAYFRSSYERLRIYARVPDSPIEHVRRRMRVRVWLYMSLSIVAIASVPLPIWIMCLVLLRVLPGTFVYLAVTPALTWAMAVPLMAPESIVRPLLERFTANVEAPNQNLVKRIQDNLFSSVGAVDSSSGPQEQLFMPPIHDDEILELRVITSDEPNASAVCRQGVTLTSWACEGEEARLLPLLAHELGHHRLRHRRTLALMHLYLWPYLYFADRHELPRYSWRWPYKSVPRNASLPFAWLLTFTGYVTLVAIRFCGRVAQRDADRYVRHCGLGAGLLAALEVASEHSTEPWLGMPVPAEHASPNRRAKQNVNAERREAGTMHAPVVEKT